MIYKQAHAAADSFPPHKQTSNDARTAQDLQIAAALGGRSIPECTCQQRETPGWS